MSGVQTNLTSLAKAIYIKQFARLRNKFNIFRGMNYIFTANFTFYITNHFIYPAYQPTHSNAMSQKLDLVARYYMSSHMY